MGRKSKLTPEQWAQIERRLLEGESRTSLGREFGLSEASIRGKFGGKVEEVKEVAQKIVAAKKALDSLPPLAQISANSLAQKLIEVSNSLASAAQHGAATAHRLSALANSEVAKIDDAQPLGSIESLKGVALLTRLANDSASISLNLMAANKDRINKATEPAPDELPPARPQISREEWLKTHGLS